MVQRYNYNILWRYMYFWMGFPWVFPSKVRDSPRLSPRFSMRSPCRRQTATGSTRRTDAVFYCSPRSWFILACSNWEMQCHAVHIRGVCVCTTEGLCMCFCSVQLAMKSHEHIIVIHCLVRTHVCLFRFVRKMIKNVAVAWCDPSLIQQTSCSMNMSMVQSCSII